MGQILSCVGTGRELGASPGLMPTSSWLQDEGLSTRGEAGQREHGDVVILAEIDCRLRGLRGAGMRREKPFQTREAVEFTCLVASFEKSIRVEGEVVSHLD